MSATKQSKAKKTASSKKPLSHPPFAEMITDAIVSLKERTGSSQYAITKFIEGKHHKELPQTFRKLILHQLKKAVAAGKLVKAPAGKKVAAAKPARKTPVKSVKKPKSVKSPAKKAKK
ncbi:Winged helix-like DNA-binding domain superfamily [Sesbania bispinosa]|nr:Winged helix-like DNA-binding domain superfamily [Sesbania bispinosa]